MGSLFKKRCFLLLSYLKLMIQYKTEDIKGIYHNKKLIVEFSKKIKLENIKINQSMANNPVENGENITVTLKSEFLYGRTTVKLVEFTVGLEEESKTFCITNIKFFCSLISDLDLILNNMVKMAKKDKSEEFFTTIKRFMHIIRNYSDEFNIDMKTKEFKGMFLENLLALFEYLIKNRGGFNQEKLLANYIGTLQNLVNSYVIYQLFTMKSYYNEYKELEKIFKENDSSEMKILKHILKNIFPCLDNIDSYEKIISNKDLVYLKEKIDKKCCFLKELWYIFNHNKISVLEQNLNIINKETTPDKTYIFIQIMENIEKILDNFKCIKVLKIKFLTILAQKLRINKLLINNNKFQKIIELFFGYNPNTTKNELSEKGIQSHKEIFDGLNNIYSLKNKVEKLIRCISVLNQYSNNKNLNLPKETINFAYFVFIYSLMIDN